MLVLFTVIVVVVVVVVVGESEKRRSSCESGGVLVREEGSVCVSVCVCEWCLRERRQLLVFVVHGVCEKESVGVVGGGGGGVWYGRE